MRHSLVCMDANKIQPQKGRAARAHRQELVIRQMHAAMALGCGGVHLVMLMLHQLGASAELKHI